MYDLDKLEKTFANPSNDRQSGKTTINCFEIAGFIDLIDSELLIVQVENINSAYHLAMSLQRVLDYLEIKLNGVAKAPHGYIKFTINDKDAKCKEIRIRYDHREETLHGINYVLYHVNQENIFDCYLDYSRSNLEQPMDDCPLLTNA